MDILVPASVAQYDLSRPPGNANPGGGVGVKYARVEEVLQRRSPSVRRVSALESIRSDFVIVDPLWFNWNNRDNREEKLEAFLQMAFPHVLLYGSEQNLLRWPARLREKLVSQVSWITHNCRYQRDMFRACGIYQSQYLCDPVPEHIFYPVQKERRIYASGQISWEKNTEALIEVFLYLQGSGIETCYIGSASTWGDGDCPAADMRRQELASELEEVTDVFLGNVSQAVAARWANSSLYHLHVATHDCSCQNQQEAALGGAVLWGLQHPINGERPVFWYKSTAEVAEAILSYQHTRQAQDIASLAQSNWSYEAFLRQFDRILQED